MTGYQPRFYRNQMGEGRFRSFTIGYKDSDLWIGVDIPSYTSKIADFAQEKLVDLRKELEAYILKNTSFASSFSPIGVLKEAPPMAHFMGNAAHLAQTGPMAAVAGSFSEFIGKAILEKFDVKELVIENGGDIFLSLERDMVFSVYAGSSTLSGKIGIELNATETPIGVCTSAGTVGPSTSFGKADAVVVISKNTGVADAFATAIGNRVQSADNIEKQLIIVDQEPLIDSILIVCEGKVGFKGKHELKLIK